ncbi:MAG: hypothetical protein WC460_03435 [Patescibacteria group bacterium]
MSDIKNLTAEQIRELLFKPLSKEDAERLREADKADSWLLARNLFDMDREETESEPD